MLLLMITGFTVSHFLEYIIFIQCSDGSIVQFLQKMQINQMHVFLMGQCSPLLFSWSINDGVVGPYHIIGNFINKTCIYVLD